MSAPDTNPKIEERRHKGAVGGIKLVLVFAAILLLFFVGWTFFAADDPEGADVQVQPGVGTVETE
ncbi:hypothetical protein [Primorskyibacter sp. 2E233]|uniref:hypothetical protein n=1 Tax=Primorskyibacter sp. 2E233 TaxID=3413431 RepID=UPI003BF33674